MYHCNECGTGNPSRHAFNCTMSPEAIRKRAAAVEKRRAMTAYQRGYEDAKAGLAPTR